MPVDQVVWERRERVFLILSGIFLCAMTLLNVIVFGLDYLIGAPLTGFAFWAVLTLLSAGVPTR